MLEVYVPVPSFASQTRGKLAPRPTNLVGKVLALVSNQKPNATEILQVVATNLKQALGLAEVRLYLKPSPSAGITEEMKATIRTECHAAVAGIGD